MTQNKKKVNCVVCKLNDQLLGYTNVFWGLAGWGMWTARTTWTRWEFWINSSACDSTVFLPVGDSGSDAVLQMGPDESWMAAALDFLLSIRPCRLRRQRSAEWLWLKRPNTEKTTSVPGWSLLQDMWRCLATQSYNLFPGYVLHWERNGNLLSLMASNFRP